MNREQHIYPLRHSKNEVQKVIANEVKQSRTHTTCHSEPLGNDSLSRLKVIARKSQIFVAIQNTYHMSFRAIGLFGAMNLYQTSLPLKNRKYIPTFH